MIQHSGTLKVPKDPKSQSAERCRITEWWPVVKKSNLLRAVLTLSQLSFL